jgi:hypothetical protein
MSVPAKSSNVSVTDEAPDTTAFPLDSIERGARFCLDLLPADRLERLARLLSPSAIRQRRLAERDKAVRDIATAFYSSLSSARDITKQMRSDLRRVTTLAGTDNAHRSALRRLLALSGGRVMSRSTFANALAGIQSQGGQNSVPASGHATSYNDAMGIGDIADGKVEEVADRA